MLIYNKHILIIHINLYLKKTDLTKIMVNIG